MSNGHLGKVIGEAGGDEAALMFANRLLWLDLKETGNPSFCSVTFRTDDGPYPPSLPDGFNKPRDLQITRRGNAELGLLMVYNKLIEPAAKRIFAKDPDARVTHNGIVIPLWHVMFTGLDSGCCLPLFVTLPQDQEGKEKAIDRIFDFRSTAIKDAGTDLCGKLITTLSQ
jgi:hypothetical protein